MSWPRIEEYYGPILRQTTVFSPQADGGDKRWKDLHHRVVEHASILNHLMIYVY
jgi:26S proteasome regulatory subunit N5